MTCTPIVPAVPSLAEPPACCAIVYNYISNGGWGSPDGASWFDLGVPFDMGIISPGWAAQKGLVWPGLSLEIEQDGTFTTTGASNLPSVPSWTQRGKYIQPAPNGNLLASVTWSSKITYSLPSAPFSWVLIDAFASAAWPPPAGYSVSSVMMDNAVAINIGSHLVVPRYVTGGGGNPNRLTCFKSTDCATWTEYATTTPTSGGGWFVDNNAIVSGIGYGINGLALIVQKMFGVPGDDITFMSLTSTTLTLPLAGNSLSVAVRAALTGFPVFNPYIYTLRSITYIPTANKWLVSLLWQKTISDPRINLWCVSDNDGASWSTYVKPAIYDSHGSRILPRSLVPSTTDETIIGSDAVVGSVVKYNNLTDSGAVIFEQPIPSAAFGDSIFPIIPSAAQRP